MQFYITFEALLRLFSGCQMWILWQPGSPFVNLQTFANIPHISDIFAAIPQTKTQHEKIRKQRTC
ncbi:hypothetical protein NIES4101_43400 [Calothrix sp. NIES-4101]|nr:hypothetical protein NIES4101_43400 [Calothrix sp. NIES-4101]